MLVFMLTRPSQQFFSHVGTSSCLYGLCHYLAAGKVTCSYQGHSTLTVTPVSIVKKPRTCTSTGVVDFNVYR